MFAHPRNSGTTSATGGNNEKIGTPKAVKPPAGAVRASALLAASTGLACFLVYASGVPWTNAPNEGGAGRNTLSAPQQPGTERPGFVERLRSVRLEDTFDFIADDGLGLVAAELAVRSTPIGEPVRRLALAPALVGAATISVLVVVMLRLGIARVAALASALTFAFSYPALHSALTIDASMARAPTLVGVFCCLLARTDHRRSRGFWGAALVLWLLGTLAEPVLLCVLPGMAIFMYMVERDRRRCGYLGTTAAIGGGLLFGLLLAMSGMVAPTSVAAGGSDQFAGFLAAVRPLGLAFLLAAAFRLCERPTREELLVWASWCAAVAWILVGTESVDTQRLATVLILTIPLAGFGMSAVLGSQPGRGHVRATGILMLVLPGSSLMGAVDELDALREDRARRLADAQVLAAALPQGAVVATARNVHEPIAGIWRFAGANGPQVVNAPLDLRRMLRLRAELPIFVFEPTRLQLEFLGFRFSNLDFAGAGLPPVARMTRWQSCTAVWGRGWVNVSDVVERGNVGIGFGERPRDTKLALYVTASGGPLGIEPGAAVRLRSSIDLDTFDRRDPSEAAGLNRLLVLDGIASDRQLGSQRFVQRLLIGRESDNQALTALRIDGRPGNAIARVLEAVDGEPVVLCPASR